MKILLTIKVYNDSLENEAAHIETLTAENEIRLSKV